MQWAVIVINIHDLLKIVRYSSGIVFVWKSEIAFLKNGLEI